MDQDGQRVVVLTDPTGQTDQGITAQLPLFYLLTLLDGERTIADAQAAFEAKFGELVPIPEIVQLVERLDEGLFLDSERFREHVAAQVAEYRAAPARPARFAGEAYPASEDECRAFLDGLFADPEGPGAPVPSCRAGEPDETTAGRSRLRGLVAPHIDLRRGGVCQAHGYHALAREAEAPDVIVVLGTSHQPMTSRFGLTRKDYDTPFGRVPTDTDLVDRLVDRLGSELLADELNHRQEHSIEFQALFLGYLYRAERRPSVLPVLVGSLHDCIATGTPPSRSDGFRPFVDALREDLAATGRRAVFVAGVDLAHVGRRFGAPEAPSAEDLASIERADRASLARLTALDPDGFFDFIAGERDERNVCGTAPITAMMHAMDASSAELLRYEQSREEDTGSVVTYASVAFWGD